MSDQNDQSQPAAQNQPNQQIQRDPKFTPKLNEALAKAQGEFVQPEKNKTVEVKKEGRVLYTTTYADLKNVVEAFRPHLTKYGLSFAQKTVPSQKGWMLVLSLRHESGEYDETHMPINLDQAPQQVGSQLTYLKRYQAAAYFGIAADDDDDGNAAHGNEATFGDKAKKQNTNSQRQQNNSAPTNKTTNPAPKPTTQVKIVSPETMGELGELMAARGVSEKEISYLVKTGFQFNGRPDQTPEKIILEVIKLLNEVDSNSTTIMAHAVKLEKQRTQPTEKTTDAKDPALFIMPLGEDGVKGQPLGKLSEATLKKILEWTGVELKKVPPVKNMPQVFDIQTNVKAFLKSVGVLNE